MLSHPKTLSFSAKTHDWFYIISLPEFILYFPSFWFICFLCSGRTINGKLNQKRREWNINSCKIDLTYCTCTSFLPRCFFISLLIFWEFKQEVNNIDGRWCIRVDSGQKTSFKGLLLSRFVKFLNIAWIIHDCIIFHHFIIVFWL
jgi:hypothetical protein